MREQPTEVTTGFRKRRVLIFAVVIITVILAAAVLFVALYQPSYKPPPFETNAVEGKPKPPESFGYSILKAAGSFSFGLVGVMYQQEDGSLRVYFTNPEENEAYLMCEVVSFDGNTLYKSGLLRPGEYIVSLDPVRKLDNEAVNIVIKIYALDLEHYYSIGTVTLDNILQPY